MSHLIRQASGRCTAVTAAIALTFVGGCGASRTATGTAGTTGNATGGNLGSGGGTMAGNAGGGPGAGGNPGGGSAGMNGSAGTSGAAGNQGTAGVGSGGSGVTGAAGAAPLPGNACADASPWTTVAGTPAYRLAVNAGARGATWNRYYEKMVAADHVNTILSTAWGRNIQGALKKGHDQAGFQMVRAHGMLNGDMNVYTEVAGAPVYNFTRLDQAYDAVVAAGMRPFVEIGFMPPPLASDASKTLHWYNNVPANISPAKDWTRWQDFMAALVQHLEQRYGAAEVRNNWYFEIWNESSWMYSLGLNGYNALYSMTVQGLLRGDPMIKVGGPAESQGAAIYISGPLATYARANNLKLDFISYHEYGQTSDGLTLAIANPTSSTSTVAYHNMITGMIRAASFTGPIFITEWGPSYSSPVQRDNEVAASYIAKVVHLVGTNTTQPAPSGFAYWTISDLYEEVDTGGNLAYREGNYGLMLKGDPRFTESFDVAKPAFNAFRLLHLMGDVTVTATGGTTADGVNAVATVSADNSAVQILVYNHTDNGAANSNNCAGNPTAAGCLVNLTVSNLPFGAGPVRVRHYLVDRNHANSYLTWTQQGKPAQPTQAQWVALRDSAELCYYESTVTPTGNSWSVSFPQSNYSVALLVISR